MVGQSALGLGLGVGGLFLGYAIDPGGMGIASGIGYMVGTSVGIWSIGAANGGKGGYLPTLLGALGGALGGLFLSALGEEVAAPYVILGVSNLGGLVAYHISDGRLRTQVEYLDRPGSGSKYVDSH